MSKSRSPEQTWSSLAKIIHLTYRKTTKREVALAEQALKVELPPSYKELVTSVGAPAIAARNDLNPKLVENLAYAVLLPAEIVKWTRRLRRSPNADEAFDEAELAHGRASTKNAIWFQLQADPSDGFVWLLDSRRADGEMRCGDYAHDYLYELDWKTAGWDSFATVQTHVAARVREHVKEHGKFTAM